MIWRLLDTMDDVAATLARNKLRSSLTAAGVFWGMFLLLVMLGFGDSLERGSIRNIGGSATNAVHVWGRQTTMPYAGLGEGRGVRFVSDDIDALRSEVPGIAWVCPRSQLGGYRNGAQVRHGDRAAAFRVMGDTADFRQIQPKQMLSGRWINPRDSLEQRKVAVIGRVVAQELFGTEEPVGLSVEVQGVWFQVVGVFASLQIGERAEREESTVHVPFETYQRVFHMGRYVSWFALVGFDDVSGEQLESRVRAVLGRRHRVHPADEQAIGSWNAQLEFERLKTLFGGIRSFTWLVGVATLWSGLVGVSNILLITVRERTREIGLRRAIGATPWSVMWMILRESLAITGLSGMLGATAGVAAVEGMRWYVGPTHASLGQPEMAPEVVLIAGALVVMSGCLAGLVPAYRAATIQPVQALRSE